MKNLLVALLLAAGLCLTFADDQEEASDLQYSSIQEDDNEVSDNSQKRSSYYYIGGRRIGLYKRAGCFKDTKYRALPVLLATFSKYAAVRQCAALSYTKGYSLFALQYGGQCFSGKGASNTYFKYGVANNCAGGVGGTWANEVFFYNARRPKCGGKPYLPHEQKCCFGKDLKARNQPCLYVPPYTRAGCFKDTKYRALPIHLATFPKQTAFRQCAALCWTKGYSLFALQYGGQCFSGKGASNTYFKYGVANNCAGGVGGTWANEVFFYNARRPKCQGKVYFPHQYQCCVRYNYGFLRPRGSYC